MAMRSIKENFLLDKKFIFLGLIIYFIWLLIVVEYVFSPRDYNEVPVYRQILERAIILSLPAISGAFFTSFFIKRPNSGLLSIFISGIIVLTFLSLYSGAVFLRNQIGGSSSIALTAIFIILFGVLFILPIIIISGVLAVLSSLIGYKIGSLISERESYQFLNHTPGEKEL